MDHSHTKLEQNRPAAALETELDASPAVESARQIREIDEATGHRHAGCCGGHDGHACCGKHHHGE